MGCHWTVHLKMEKMVKFIICISTIFFKDESGCTFWPPDLDTDHALASADFLLLSKTLHLSLGTSKQLGHTSDSLRGDAGWVIMSSLPVAGPDATFGRWICTVCSSSWGYKWGAVEKGGLQAFPMLLGGNVPDWVSSTATDVLHPHLAHSAI